ncbi:tetratricopeptide repeat protein [Bacteroidota bacterium]
MRFFTLLIILFQFTFLFSQGIHAPSDLITLLESSEIKYNLDVSDLKVEAVDRTELFSENIFYRLDSSGTKVTRIYPYELGVKNEVKDLYNLASDLYKNGETNKARNLCVKILGLAPDYYRVMTLIGQTYLLEGNFDKAQEILENTILINDLDFKSHWYLAEVLLLKGIKKRAVYEITVAKVLNRNHMGVDKALRRIYKKCNVRFKDWSFVPQMKIDKMNDSLVYIHCREDWLGYALCKTLWYFEPGYCESMGVRKDQQSIIEERECLANFMVSVGICKKKYKSDEVICALNKALELNHIAEFIYFEIWLPENPYLVYGLPTAMLERIALYILDVRTSKNYNFMNILKS